MTTAEALHISVSISSAPAEVYAFASNPLNLPKWAAGLSGSIEKSGDHWMADSPMGEIKIIFTPVNAFGVLDHDVTIPTGETFHNPMRVLKNGNGSEVVFTLYRQPQMSEKDFKADAAQVAKDLAKLKALLEE